MTPLVPGVLRVVTANIQGGNDQPLAVASMLVATTAQILVVLEWDGENLELETLEAAGYREIAVEPDRGARGIGVFALGSGVGAVIPSPVDGPCDLPWVTARIEVDGVGAIAVLGVHAPPPYRGCRKTTAPTLEALSARIDGGVLNVDLGPLRRGDALLVAGDLNSRGSSRRFERLLDESGLHDAPEERGTAHATWPSAIPLVRIDHLLVPPGWKVYTTWALPIPGSDHLAVLADLQP